MIYLSIALGALLVLQHLHYERRMDKLRAESASREISLLNRIQAPEIAVAQSLPEPEGQEPLPVDDSPYADAAYAEYLERTS
jgi:hypothetical protein